MSDLDARIAAFPVKSADVGGGRITYREAGAGTALVFLHGIGSGSASWLHQCEQLSAHYRVLAWDAPGYGESSPLPGTAPSVDQYAARLCDWLRALALEEFHLVAHSLGALIAGAYCQLEASLPKTLTYLDPTLGYGALGIEERDERSAKRIGLFKRLGARELARQRAPALLSKNASAECVALIEYNMQRLNKVGYPQAVRLLNNTDLLDVVDDIDAPVLVMCGSEDDITPARLSKTLAQQYSNGRYRDVDGAGHASYIEQPKTVNDCLIRHFEGN